MQLLSTSGSLSFAHTTSRLAGSWTCPFMVIAIGLLRYSAIRSSGIERCRVSGKALSSCTAVVWDGSLARALSPRGAKFVRRRSRLFTEAAGEVGGVGEGEIVG